MSAHLQAKPDEKAGVRKAFYRRIAGQNLAALWERVGGLVTPSPRPAAPMRGDCEGSRK